MQKSIISWTNHTWNPTHGCSKVSDGCKFCYAMTLSLKRGWTSKPWTIQNEEENVLLKPHKLAEPYTVKEASARIFVNSMSDLFHRVIPDWYRAAIFNVMLDTPQFVYQILTKRPELTIDWHEKYHEGTAHPEYLKLTQQHPNKHVRSALVKKHETPWAGHIWQGASVEDARVLHRIDNLRQNKAQVRFISAEPLLGAWGGSVDLSGIHWIIVGGESGTHLNTPDHPRWMQQAWARQIRDLCVAQKVAFFYKQDSGIRTEMRPYLIEENGTFWRWWQYPGDLAKAVQVNASGEPLAPEPVTRPAVQLPLL